MEDEDLKEATQRRAVQALRNWHRECHIQMNISSSRQVVEKFSNEIDEVGHVLAILDPTNQVEVAPEFDVSLRWMRLTKFPWSRAYDFLRDAVLELHVFRFENGEIMAPVRGIKKARHRKGDLPF